MSQGVAKWAQDANNSYHFLTVAQLQEIDVLEQQGRVADAVALTMTLLSDRMEQSQAPLTAHAQAWKAVTESINSAWEAFVRWNQAHSDSVTVDDQIKQLQGRMDVDQNSGGVSDAFKAQQHDQMAALVAQRDAAQKAAAQTSSSAQATQLGLSDPEANGNRLAQLKEQVATYGKGTAAVEEYAMAQAKARAEALPDAAARTQAIADAIAIHQPLIDQAKAYDALVASKKNNRLADQEGRLNDELAKQTAQQIQQHANALDQFNGSIGAITGRSGSNGNAALDKYLDQMEQIDRIRRQASKSGLDEVETSRRLDEATRSVGDAYAYQAQQFQRAYDEETQKIIAGNILDPYLRQLAQATQEFDKAAADAKKALDNGSITQPEYDSRMGALTQKKDDQTANAGLSNSVAGGFGLDTVQKLNDALHPIAGIGRDIGVSLKSAFSGANEDLSKLITNTVVFGNKGGVSIKSVARAFEADLIGSLIKVALQMAENYAIGLIFGHAASAAAAGEAAAVATAWGPAATAASIATFGAADAEGVAALGVALTAGAGITAAAGAAAAGVGTSAAGGYDIPAGVNPVVQTHAQEMILPAWIANPLRAGIRSGGGSNSGGSTQMKVSIINSNGSAVRVRQMSDDEIHVLVNDAHDSAVDTARSAVVTNLQHPSSDESQAIRQTHNLPAPVGTY